MNWNYSIAFNIAGASNISNAEQAVTRLDTAVDKANSSANQAGQSFQGMGSKGENAFNKMVGAAKRYLAVATLIAGLSTSVGTAAQAQSTDVAINFATGGQGAESLEFVRKEAERLSIDLESSRDGFKTIAASMRGTNMEGAETQRIFTGVATASGAMGLKADEVKGAFLALSQMASKGKVQAEELRGQLGERIPGAFALAAKAMNVTQAELNDMLDRGEVVADEFLPRFAAELTKTYAAGAADMAATPAARLRDWRNAVFELKVAFGNQLLPALASVISAGLPLVAWLGENIRLVSSLALGITALVVNYKLAWFWTGAWAAITRVGAAAQLLFSGALGRGILISKLSTLATNGMTGAMAAFNTALRLNPIGFVVGLLITLVSATTYAWNNMKGFRTFITGMWSVIKEFGSILYDFVIAPLMNIGNLVIGVFTFDKARIASAITDAVGILERQTEGIAGRIGKAYYDGATAGAMAFNKKQNAADAVSKAFANTDSKDPASPTDPTKKTDGMTGIVGRGSTKNIQITLNSLVNSLSISANSADEGTDEMQELVQRKLLQILNTANQVQ